ncbi:MAG TPA: hypothetical protein DCZ74_01430 [Treponema sp.]|nr:hypothetical protein [Treponema sp.]
MPESNHKKRGGFFKSLALTALAFGSLLCSSCSKTERPVIIWTDHTEFASYAELFNSTHENEKVVVLYKETPASALPPAKDETPPDIVIAPWLKNTSTRRLFTSVDYLFSDDKLHKEDFYPQLIEYGVMNEKQYLLPVSFNLPAIVFSKQHEDLIEDDHLLTVDNVKTIAATFNARNQKGTYTAIGYAPSWDSEFMYQVAKIMGADFQERGQGFDWNSTAITLTVNYLRQWTLENNTSTTTEQNFQFKYLYMPKYRRIATDKCLFAFMTSSELFTLTNEQSMDLAFRWLVTDNRKLMVDDAIITAGLYKHTKNRKAAEEFLLWLSSKETQRKLMERTESMDLDTVTFGIAGGFSALMDVNADVYPSHYRVLLGNLPSQENLAFGNILPHRWNMIKEKAILPYLLDASNTENEVESVKPLEERMAESNRLSY